MDATHRGSLPETPPVSSLGGTLEHDRLQHRAVRVRQVLEALHERARTREDGGEPPRPLRAAIEDFGRELAEVERRLRLVDGRARR